MQKAVFRASEVLRVGGYFGRWYGGGGGLVPKWGRFEGRVLSGSTGLEPGSKPLVPARHTVPKWAVYRVNLGTKLPSRTMGIPSSIKDTTFKRRNRWNASHWSDKACPQRSPAMGMIR